MLFPIAIHLCLGKAFVFVVIFLLPSLWGSNKNLSWKCPWLSHQDWIKEVRGGRVRCHGAATVMGDGRHGSSCGDEEHGQLDSQGEGQFLEKVWGWRFSCCFTEIFKKKNSTILYDYIHSLDVQKYGNTAGCSWFKSFQAMSSFLHRSFCIFFFVVKSTFVRSIPLSSRLA